LRDSLVNLPASSTFATPRPLLTPLALGGFSARVVEAFAKDFESLGLLPVAGGGGGTGASLKFTPGVIEPGGAIGVQLIRGDYNATAIGTATYVDKDMILAFGHPFEQGGHWAAPAAR